MAGNAKKKKSKGRNNNSPDMRSQILKTALNLFTTRGYFNTSVHHIQKQGRVSIGTIYHYFKNKEAIAKALYDDLISRMSKIISDIREQHQTAHDRCYEIMKYLFELTESDPEAMQFMLYARHQEFMPDERPVCSSLPFEMIKKMISQGIENREIIPLEPVVASASIFGGALRLIHLRLDRVLDEPVTHYLEDVWECAWRSVKNKDNTGTTGGINE